MLFTKVLSTVGLLAAQAAAHGAVTSYVIDGTTYAGYDGFNPSSSSKVIQRQWPVVKVMCNGGTSASLNAPVKAGGKIRANWKQWTHQQGPVMVWMYKCAGDFSACDGSGKKWFKIDQKGMTAPPLSGTAWGTADVYKNLYWESTVPAALAPGNYLIRHELLALHQANTPQFYAECAQVVVSGSGTGVPSGDFLATIPGYAAQSDPGVTVDTYGSKATTYTCPGPAVWTG